MTKSTRSAMVNVQIQEELKMQKIKRFFKDESGATAIEYGLIVAVMALIIIGAFALFGDAITGVFEDIVDAMSPTT
jgi:pilus assembly protein Flp/PilA